MNDTNNTQREHHHELPSHFQALQFLHRGGQLELKEVKMPAREHLGPMEVIVKVKACGVSCSDRVTQDQLLSGIHYPRTPGHEFIGQVCAMGKEVSSCKMGDMVGGSWHGGHCFMCEPCREGDFACCQRLEINGVTRDGGLAEYVHCRVESLVMCPKDMDPAEMTAMMHQGATIFSRNMIIAPGELVAIHGAGGLGKLACDISRAMGYRTCMVGEGGRRSMESIEGSEHVKMGQVAEELKKMGGAKVILCCLPESKHLGEFVKGLQSNGQLLLITMGHESRADLPMSALISRRLAIVGYPSPTPIRVEESLQFFKMHNIGVKLCKFSLKEGRKAYEMAMDEDEMKKAVVMMD